MHTKIIKIIIVFRIHSYCSFLFWEHIKTAEFKTNEIQLPLIESSLEVIEPLILSLHSSNLSSRAKANALREKKLQKILNITEVTAGFAVTSPLINLSKHVIKSKNKENYY